MPNPPKKKRKKRNWGGYRSAVPSMIHTFGNADVPDHEPRKLTRGPARRKQAVPSRGSSGQSAATYVPPRTPAPKRGSSGQSAATYKPMTEFQKRMKAIKERRDARQQKTRDQVKKNKSKRKSRQQAFDENYERVVGRKMRRGSK